MVPIFIKFWFTSHWLFRPMLYWLAYSETSGQFPVSSQKKFSLFYFVISRLLANQLTSKIELYIPWHILNVILKFQIDRMLTRILRSISMRQALNPETMKWVLHCDQPVQHWPEEPVTSKSELNENWYNKTYCFTLPCAKILLKSVLI